MRIFVVLMVAFSTIVDAGSHVKRVLICGVCKNVESAIPNLIKNVEALGPHFDDYRVVIYENNSIDQTAALLAQWAAINKKIVVVSEILEKTSSVSRTENIARARNKVLDIVKEKYPDYEYFMNVDLDFQSSWPIDEIVKTIHSKKRWHCVSANGLWGDNLYWDRYAYRSRAHPLGPELLGDQWWRHTVSTWFKIEGEKWQQVYSAFGGLALYKTAAIIQCRYSGTVTQDLARYYKKILKTLSNEHIYKEKYLNLVHHDAKGHKAPIIFQHNTLDASPSNYPYVTCCEHVTLHASMALRGFNKMYINPKMKIRYSH